MIDAGDALKLVTVGGVGGGVVPTVTVVFAIDEPDPFVAVSVYVVVVAGDTTADPEAPTAPIP